MFSWNSKMFIAGYRGLVGNALVRLFQKERPNFVLLRYRTELDLLDQARVRDFFEEEKPDFVILATAKIGGIFTNSIYPERFLYQNL